MMMLHALALSFPLLSPFVLDDLGDQGEYVARVEAADGAPARALGVQVIALGKERFAAVLLPGGLPGDGWDGETRHVVEGERSALGIVMRGDVGGVVLANGICTVTSETLGAWVAKRVERKSPTLGAQAPKDAIVLFDGKKVNAFVERDGKPAQTTEDGLLMQGCTSVPQFGGRFLLHLEFLLPFQPEARGQGRGNSGCYLQGRYEVQMLDSFGLTGEHNECGGVYSLHKPRVNMCFPPMVWQTYDVEFEAAIFDASGKLEKPSLMTVRHNGVVIHDKVALPRTTTAAPVPLGPEPGPIYLQDHGNPVRYRNVWVLPRS
ncbi:MAG: DUF1080 domain-containing protein [Planctomycetes bacterium]|nr:DUF1080 domain-containing protein [Planctomycetota bacterium]